MYVGSNGLLFAASALVIGTLSPVACLGVASALVESLALPPGARDKLAVSYRPCGISVT